MAARVRLTGLGPGDVLTVAEAARALRLGHRVASDWLRAKGLVVSVAGRDRVVWADVLSALRTTNVPLEVQPTPRRGCTLRRAGL